MITITLQFKNIDSAIKALREIPETALAAQTLVVEPTTEEMSAALQAKNAIAQAAAPAAQEAKTSPKSATAATSKTTAKAEAGAAPAKTDAAPPPPAASAVTFDELKKAFLVLSTKNMAACKAVLATMGVEKLSGLTPEQYAAAMDYIKAQSV